MKTKILIISSLIFGGLIFSSCQKDNLLIEETSFEQQTANQDAHDSFKTGSMDGSHNAGSLEEDMISNFPDPFKYSTTIQYHLKRESWVCLSVSPNNPEQNKIMLVNELQGVGKQLVRFNADGLPNGEYIVELKIGSVVYNEVITKRQNWDDEFNAPVSGY